MRTRFPSSASWSMASYPRIQASETTSHQDSARPSAFLRWLDNYFRATPEERMSDAYNAYWH
ncbi:MAG: hypothetical protein E6H71_00190 [Betaproteobacteria bacterium]|nr:MAG: hypothetical protein E6H71_00190 [Betaproteobacteria bacterium]